MAEIVKDKNLISQYLKGDTQSIDILITKYFIHLIQIILQYHQHKQSQFTNYY